MWFTSTAETVQASFTSQSLELSSQLSNLSCSWLQRTGITSSESLVKGQTFLQLPHQNVPTAMVDAVKDLAIIFSSSTTGKLHKGRQDPRSSAFLQQTLDNGLIKKQCSFLPTVFLQDCMTLGLWACGSSWWEDVVMQTTYLMAWTWKMNRERAWNPTIHSEECPKAQWPPSRSQLLKMAPWSPYPEE